MAYDPAVVRAIQRIGRKRGMSKEAILAALATGIVESGLTNIKGGDADSSGWRQEQAHLYKDPNNLKASINRFYNEFLQHDTPGFNPGLTAANVQRPAEQFRGRYADVMDQARKLMGSNYVGGPSGGSVGLGTPGNTVPLDEAPNIFSTLAGMNQDNPTIQSGYNLMAQLQARRSQGGMQQPMPVGSGGPVGGSGSKIFEMFYDPIGQWDSGRWSNQGIGGHDTHVHVAARQKLLNRLAKKAQNRFGLEVREFEPYDKVDPVHAEGSFHDSNQAMDVSGDRMADYARWLRRRFHLR